MITLYLAMTSLMNPYLENIISETDQPYIILAINLLILIDSLDD